MNIKVRRIKVTRRYQKTKYNIREIEKQSISLYSSNYRLQTYVKGRFDIGPHLQSSYNKDLSINTQISNIYINDMKDSIRKVLGYPIDTPLKFWLKYWEYHLKELCDLDCFDTSA